MALQSIDYGTYWTMSDKVSRTTANFHSLVEADAWLPENDYLVYETKCSTPSVLTHQGTKKFSPFRPAFVRSVMTGTHQTAFGDEPCKQLDDYHAYAESRLAVKVREAAFEGGVALAEYRKTADTIAGAMTRVAGAYRDLRKGRVRSALRKLAAHPKNGRQVREIPKTAADNWLAFTYGVKPILYDVHGALEVLERTYGPPLDIIKERTAKTYRHDPSVNLDGSSLLYINRCRGTVACAGGVKFRIDNPLLASLSSVGLTNPLSVAWELVPFSFVVDWFIPVGDYLLSIVPPRGVSFLGGYTSVLGRGHRFEFEHLKGVPEPGWTLRSDTQEFIYDRRALDDWPAPTFNLPDLSLTWQQVTSGVSLLIQAGTGGRRG